MEKYKKQDPLVHVLQDTAWHEIMPGPVFYGQRNEEEIVIHGGNLSFAGLLEKQKKYLSYPCDGKELFAESSFCEEDGSSVPSPTLELLFTGNPGWSKGIWSLFGGDEIVTYALFEDANGWFVFFLESGTSKKILEERELLGQKLEELAQLYSAREMFSPLTATLREALHFDWTGVLSWNSGEERWVLTAYNGGEKGDEDNYRMAALLKAFHAEEEQMGVRFGGLEIKGRTCWWIHAGMKDSPWSEALGKQKIASFFAGTLVEGAQPMLFLGFSGEGNRISRIEREIFKGVWPQVSSMAERYRLIGGMVGLSTTDSVTGLAQGNTFLQKVSVELSRNRRYSYPISLLYLNIQNQDALKEAGGTGAVEDAFRFVTREAVESIRVVDMIGRLDDGGILVLLPHTGFEGAQVVAERMKERFRGLSPLPSVPMDVMLRSLSYSEGLIPDTDRVLEEIRK
ncbi:MAG TPA: diguanylate cyclase [Synergistaceae bacterium]|nr:diguanylate cyclase [Synergistaceae bacterium]HPJ26862.1 diguanylate cyclase [Synergistaceae bacterium]HPQ38257.1 diguanylate cyclase [Synergistaceae bacterium]